MNRGYTIYPQPIRPPVCGELPYRSRLLTNADGDTAQISEPDDATVDATPPNVSSPIARIPAWVMFWVTAIILALTVLALVGVWHVAVRLLDWSLR